MSSESHFTRSVLVLAAVITVVGGVYSGWHYIDTPGILRQGQMSFEYESDSIRVVDAKSHAPIPGVLIRFWPTNSGPVPPLRPGMPFWTTDADGVASPTFIPDWPPVQTPAGAEHHFHYIAMKDGYDPATFFVAIPAGRPVVGRQEPRFLGN